MFAAVSRLSSFLSLSCSFFAISFAFYCLAVKTYDCLLPVCTHVTSDISLPLILPSSKWCHTSRFMFNTSRFMLNISIGLCFKFPVKTYGHDLPDAADNTTAPRNKRFHRSPRSDRNNTGNSVAGISRHTLLQVQHEATNVWQRITDYDERSSITI